MSILEKVKLALRIRTDALDEEIENNIETAKDELKRVGVPDDVVTDGGNLIDKAVETFVKAQMLGDPAMREKMEESFKYQADNLRKGVYADVQ